MKVKPSLFYWTFWTLLTCFTLLPCQCLAAERVIYATGFEENNGQYLADGTVFWEYGTPDTVNKPAGPAACNGGQKCWGTKLSSMVWGEGDLVSPTIEIPALAAGQVARLSFHAYIDVAVMSSNSGSGDIYLSSDNKQSWKKLAHLLEKMAGGWQRYDFDISEFAGKSVNLRFHAFLADYAADPGLYIDDIAVTIVDLPSPSKTLTLTAWEDPADSASCPWVFTWDGTQFVRDNDIYSVARTPQGKMRDFYLLQKPLIAQDGSYHLEVRELEAEDSWTDLVGLKTIDHAADVAVAPDNSGKLSSYQPAALVAPVSATTKAGLEARGLIGAKDDSGFHAYSGDYLDLSFPAVDPAAGARLVLRIKGFQAGEGEPAPFTGPPAVVVQLPDGSGGWQEIGRLNPRFDWSVGAFDLARYLPDPAQPLKVRLASISHATKFHEIDLAALSLGPQPPFAVRELPLRSASYAGKDVLELLSAADNQSLQMGTGNRFACSFAALPLESGQVREFLLVTDGYYVPHGNTYFVYTWDGSKWAQRDAVSFTTPTGNATSTVMDSKDFDLSSYLPDPQGEFKVRIWQDYCYETAGIDFVGMKVDVYTGTLAAATDLRSGTDISAQVQAKGDGSTLFYDLGRLVNGVRPRDRWTEFKWSGLPEHVPPTVPDGLLHSLGGNIRWGYYSPTQDTQAGFDIQVWTGANATGSVVWSPPSFMGASTVLRYAGSLLTPGRTYYLRVRLFDGKAWGPWVETPFVAPLRNGVLASEGGTPGVADALKAVRIATGSLTATDADLDTGDIAPLDAATGLPKGDGKIDVFDVIGILRKIVGL